MSVTIATNPQPASWWQRLTGTEPKTVVREVSTTEVSSISGGSFDLKTALRNGGIGAAVAGALGGVSLLGKVALPLIGRIGSVSGLLKFAGLGGALGVATAALPLVASAVEGRPAAKAAVTGAAIGAAAGAVLPLMPIWLGAGIGAGVGLLIHNRNNHPQLEYATYPGYTAYPGYSPMGMGSSAAVPGGMIAVTPNYSGYAASAMNPYGYGYGAMGASPYASYGYGSPMVGGYGSMMTLPAQATQVQAQQRPVVTRPAVAPAPAPAPARPASAPKYPHAKTWIDKSGNVRQLGTGKVVKAAAPAPAASAAVGRLPINTALTGASSVATDPTAAYLAALNGGNNAALAGLPVGAIPAMPTAGSF